MEAPNPRRAARQLVDRITADFEDLQAAGVEITGVGVAAGDRVRVHLRRLDQAWIDLMRARYGDDVDYELGDYPRLV